MASTGNPLNRDPLNYLMTMLMSGDVPNKKNMGVRMPEGGQQGTGRTPPGYPREPEILGGPLMPPMGTALGSALGRGSATGRVLHNPMDDALQSADFLDDILRPTGLSKALGEKGMRAVRSIWMARHLGGRTLVSGPMRARRWKKQLDKMTGPSELHTSEEIKKYMEDH